MSNKCKHIDESGNEIIVKPDGVNELDPCLYRDEMMYTNVNIIVAHCIKCGHRSIIWTRTENTEEIDLSEQ